MIPLVHVGPNAIRRLEQLDLEEGKLVQALLAASGDARLCTRFDSPIQPAITFWSRTNRYIREDLTKKGWKYTNRQLILRTIHPSKRFAITAMSGSGDIGKEKAEHIQARNPKGAAVRDVVVGNKQLEIKLPGIPAKGEESKKLVSIPTWFLLYSWTEEGIFSELSFPVEMTGRFVDQWRERIPLGFIPMDGPPSHFSELDLPDADDGFDVPVEFTG